MTKRQIIKLFEQRTALDTKIDAQLREIENILGIKVEEL